jgi:hydrogenase expression/formation protein HypD
LTTSFRVVSRDGNTAARELIWSAFEVCDRKWRGIGAIPKSGLRLRWELRDWDAERRFDVGAIETLEPAASAAILRGHKPLDCPSFNRVRAGAPLGTMVKPRACAAYHAGRPRGPVS